MLPLNTDLISSHTILKPTHLITRRHSINYSLWFAILILYLCPATPSRLNIFHLDFRLDFIAQIEVVWWASQCVIGDSALCFIVGLAAEVVSVPESGAAHGIFLFSDHEVVAFCSFWFRPGEDLRATL